MRWWWGRRAALAGVLVLAAGCSATQSSLHPPRAPDDACAIFKEKKDWYADACDAEERWGVPVAVQLAFIRTESSFRHDARPPRRKVLGMPTGPRPSTALGYAQALDGTWEEYQQATGAHGADRDDFADAVDFIGWYNARSVKMCGISRKDAYRLYLAYHEGQQGYLQGTHRRKAWLLDTAQKVAERASRYNSQLRRCESQLSSRRGFLFF